MNYNVSTVINALSSIVGFESREGYTLPTSLTSGTLILNDYHPLLQLSVLDSVRPEGTSLEDFLINTRKSAITTVLDDLFTLKLKSHSIKTKLHDTQIFDSTARFSNLMTKSGRFVGWTFKPVKSEHTFHKISKIAIQTLLPQNNIPIYVYHSSQKFPVQSTTINSAGNSSVTWTTLSNPITLNWLEHDAGGFYFIGYFEDDLDANNRVIFKDYDLTKPPCGSCNYFNVKSYREWSPYIAIHPASFESKYVNGTEQPSLENLTFSQSSNYGLNFRVESYCDVTNFLVNNVTTLAPTVRVKWAINLIKYVEMNPLRSNKVTDQMANEAFTTINGLKSENNYIKVRGLIHDYEDYLKGLNLDLSKIDPVCLPSSSRGIRWT